MERDPEWYDGSIEGKATVENSIHPGSVERLDAERTFSEELASRIKESPFFRRPVSNCPKPKLPFSNGA